MNTLQFNEIATLTRLPLEVIQVPTSPAGMLRVRTPHKGIVEIDLQEMHIPFLFGSAKTIDRTASDVVGRIRDLERGAIDFWFREFSKKS